MYSISRTYSLTAAIYIYIDDICVYTVLYGIVIISYCEGLPDSHASMEAGSLDGATHLIYMSHDNQTTSYPTKYVVVLC